jgi:hypothetical protein
VGKEGVGRDGAAARLRFACGALGRGDRDAPGEGTVRFS